MIPAQRSKTNNTRINIYNLCFYFLQYLAKHNVLLIVLCCYDSALLLAGRVMSFHFLNRLLITQVRRPKLARLLIRLWCPSVLVLSQLVVLSVNESTVVSSI